MNGLSCLMTERGQKLALLSLSALIVISGVAWYYDYNQWLIHHAHQAKIAVLKQNITTARRLASDMTQTAALRAEIQQFVDVHEATMVSDDQFTWVIREISQLAESQPVDNVTPQPGNVVPHARKSMCQWYVTHLGFVGDYDQIGMFVQELENHFPEAEIRSLNIVATATPTSHRTTLDLFLLMRPVVAPAAVTVTTKSDPHS